MYENNFPIAKQTEVYESNLPIAKQTELYENTFLYQKKKKVYESNLPIGRFSEAGLLEWMRFVIFRARCRERSQRTSGPISE